MATPRVRQQRSLASIPLKEIYGLTAQNERELTAINIKNAQQLCDALLKNNGDFTGLQDSTGGYPIDRGESGYIGDRVLEADWCPQEIKDKFSHTGSPLIHETPAQTAQEEHVQREPNWLQRFFGFEKK